MNIKTVSSLGVITALLAACGGGDVNISPSTTDNSVDNSTTTTSGGPSSPCASYVDGGGATVTGIQEGNNCRYTEDFVSSTNRLTVDLNIPDLPNNGAHIFEASLFVGETYNTDAALTSAGITQGGDGPTLTIAPGATLAFESSADFMVINRGAQIMAVGTSTAPITITSVSDVFGTVGPEDVSQWGGMVINGFGVTNKCAYTGTVAGGDLATTDCHVDSEGAAGVDESQYGGANNADSSGRLEYVIVKHTGAQVANGDELNGITFSGVGSGTIVNNIEAYSTFDDGIELFGGAVNINNYVAVYVRDDSIDIDEGYSGTITNALVIQSATDGNNCIESDGIGSFDDLMPAEIEAIINQGINSRPTINNLTCVISPNGAATATHDPGAGWRFREGIFPTINNSMIIGSFAANDTTSSSDNYCLRIDNRSRQAALDGDLQLNNIIFACAEARNDDFGGGVTEVTFAQGVGNIFATIPSGTAVNATASADPALQLLEGSIPIYSIDYDTAQVDGMAPAAGSDPDPRAFLGALSLGEADWTQPWAYGIRVGNRAQPLWFE